MVVSCPVFLIASSKLRVMNIEDFGCGISTSQSSLCENGYSTKYGSLGCGLSIVQHYTNEVGAYLKIEGKAEGGTVVTVSFPND